jgi:hypothetical protein
VKRDLTLHETRQARSQGISALPRP